MWRPDDITLLSLDRLRILSMPINLALSIYQNITYKALPGGYTLKPLNSIPEKVDTFIDENCEQIHVQRTKKYLDWRFIKNPRRKFIILGLYVNDELRAITNRLGTLERVVIIFSVIPSAMYSCV